MRGTSFKQTLLPPLAVLAAVLWLRPVALGATEFGATHLVFERPTGMKKVAATLYMSVVDRSLESDEPGNRRRLRCAVAAMGKNGPLAARGEVGVRLRGEAGSALATWQGSELVEPLDGRGEVEFDDEAILALVDEASAAGAKPELFSIEFDGGKGKRVTQVTVDCIQEPVDG